MQENYFTLTFMIRKAQQKNQAKSLSSQESQSLDNGQSSM